MSDSPSLRRQTSLDLPRREAYFNLLHTIHTRVLSLFCVYMSVCMCVCVFSYVSLSFLPSVSMSFLLVIVDPASKGRSGRASGRAGCRKRGARTLNVQGARDKTMARSRSLAS